MKTVRQIMSPDPACCTPDTSISDIARMMVDFDCGAIPVVESDDVPRPVGIVTDRDIVCRLIAEGVDPLDSEAKDCMTKPCICVPVDSDVNAAHDLLKKNKIRRLVVIDANGYCCGMVSLADLVLGTSDTGLVRDVSEPTDTPSEAQAPKVEEPEPA